MDKKYLSVHFEHNDGILTFKPRITSLEIDTFSQEEGLDYSDGIYHLAAQQQHKNHGLIANLSPEEESDFSSFDAILDYSNEPELHIFYSKNPFSEDIDQVAYLTNDRELITSLTPGLIDDKSDWLEDNFLDCKIYDYSYGATTDRLMEVRESLFDEDYFSTNAELLLADITLKHEVLHVTVIGQSLTLENDMASDTWSIYLDQKKWAEISHSAEDCRLEDQVINFFDTKDVSQKASGSISLMNGKIIEFEDIESILWKLI